MCNVQIVDMNLIKTNLSNFVLLTLAVNNTLRTHLTPGTDAQLLQLAQHQTIHRLLNDNSQF